MALMPQFENMLHCFSVQLRSCSPEEKYRLPSSLSQVGLTFFFSEMKDMQKWTFYLSAIDAVSAVGVT